MSARSASGSARSDRTSGASIRPYRSSDLDACRELWRELAEHHAEIYEDPSIAAGDPGLPFDRHLEDRRLAGVWVAESGERVVGLAGLLVQGEEAEVEPVVVRREHRSQGLGEHLLRAAIDEARARGVRFLSVRPVARNRRALEFFHRCGFRLLGHVDLFMELARGSRRAWKSGIRIHGCALRF